ncbi:hypothetical protein GC387_32020 [Pseudomonas sp. MWU12-2323]|uniref:DUF4345 domain-containing protein n=3 Tax=Pseudomonas TaxID=286 RepID=A0A7Y7WX40_9PSED|nr:hypothetical protein [Pseudomonas sp. MWU12-2323]NWB88137.1 hypothetical protein [Pseudomonas gingeri]RBH59035.1 hypothetical protein C3F00_004525 [Pseudomonas sp. MWU13-2860]
MTLRFHTVCTWVCALCLALALIWMWVPELLLQSWNVGYTEATGLVARRSAALFLGIALMLARLRSAPPSVARTAVADGFAVTGGVLAVLGVGELWAGHAGPGILSAVLVELITAWALASSVRHKPAPRSEEP